MSFSLLEKIETLKNQAGTDLQSVSSEQATQELKVKYLGKKGMLTQILKELGGLSPELRRQIGQAANDFKSFLENSIDNHLAQEKKKSILKNLEQEKIDITLPGRQIAVGKPHPVIQVLDEIKSFFIRFGFDVYSGPEIETDYYNFEALGIPANHPARDMQDTFYVESSFLQGQRENKSSSLLLRTHTSPVQIRIMERRDPPIRMIAPGVVYRRDSDVTHTPMFHQIEGLLVDQQITFADLKGIMTHFLHDFFDATVPLQFRPSYFPFTEPSAEVDIGCVMCKGKGCRVCKGTGWLEVLGCGMVDPEVFKYVNYDSEKYTGFAFGMGIERLTMLKFGIDDIRLFFENDVRFLRQF